MVRGQPNLGDSGSGPRSWPSRGLARRRKDTLPEGRMSFRGVLRTPAPCVIGRRSDNRPSAAGARSGVATLARQQPRRSRPAKPRTCGRPWFGGAPSALPFMLRTSFPSCLSRPIGSTRTWCDPSAPTPSGVRWTCLQGRPRSGACQHQPRSVDGPWQISRHLAICRQAKSALEPATPDRAWRTSGC